MVLTPRPKRRQPQGCGLALILVPLAGLLYFLRADYAFNLLEAAYWLAIMWAAFSVLQVLFGDPRGNPVAWPIVVSAYAAAGLDWHGVSFDPWLWRSIDLFAIACIVGIRRWAGLRLSRSDWAIIALFVPAWWAYDRSDYTAYVVSAAVVIAQCAVAVAATSPRLTAALGRTVTRV